MQLIKNGKILLSLLALGFGYKQGVKDYLPAKPNIIFVLTDDQGYGDLSCLGSPDVSTPNIDH